MKFPEALIEGRLIKRYKRFLADIELSDGNVVTAHVPNSGSMMGLIDPGNRVWISLQDRPERKLKYTLELIEVDGSLVGVNTSWPNELATEAILEGKIPELNGYFGLKREVPRGSSRFDIMLDNDKHRCYVEVKNVTLRRGQGAYFPDAVTSRGTKHLRELENVIKGGDRGVMLYIVQRMDCDYFSYAQDIDPFYWQTYKKVVSSGLEVLAYQCYMSTNMITVAKSLPIKL